MRKGLRVLFPGLQTTVQDMGRPGHGLIGVPPSGAADKMSLRIGNFLLENDQNTSALEMTLLGGTFQCFGDTTIALTGSDFSASIDNQELETYTVYDIRDGQILKIGHTKEGARAYLCVDGGFEVLNFLGSASTHIISGLGGYEGRALKVSDVLRFKNPQRNIDRMQIFHRKIEMKKLESLRPQKVLRATRGFHFDLFSKSSQKSFFSQKFKVSDECDRMGLKLQGPVLDSSVKGELTSLGVSLGTVQVSTQGNPTILFVDQQTTGGYPQIATVITADAHSLGQLKPGDEICFEEVNYEKAEIELKNLEAALDEILK